MKEVKVTMYEANDGQRYDTAEACVAHEKEITEIIKAKQKFNDLIDFCAGHASEEYDDYQGCSVCISTECPFYNESFGHNCMFGCLPYCDLEKLEI